jgi:hypothetical protein
MALSLYTYLTVRQSGIDNLGNNDKEVENTHVNSHFIGEIDPANMAYGIDKILAQAIPTPIMDKISQSSLGTNRWKLIRGPPNRR